MGGAVGERPGHGGEHPLGGSWTGLSDVEQDERARAVGVLRHSRHDTGLAEQRRLLIACHAADGETAGDAGSRRRHADASARRHDGRQGADRNVQERTQLGVPRSRADVAQHRAAGVADIGGEHLAAGQLPDQPGVDRADGQIVVDRDVTICQEPFGLRSREVRVEHQPGPLPNEIEMARRSEFVAPLCGATVLPDDGVAVGRTGRSVPGEHRFALVRDSDGRHCVDPDVTDHVVQGDAGGGPDLVGIVFDPTRLGIVLGELSIRACRGSAVGEHRPAANPGRAGIDGDHTRRCHGRRM